jgi:U3 small nucleolar RNA-associated protein 13
MWRNCRLVTLKEEEGLLAAEARVLHEQDLLRFISRKDYAAAVEAAFELNHSFRLWGVLSDMVEAGETLDQLVRGWDDGRLLKTFEFLREWNTNATKSRVAQGLLSSILTHVPFERLRQLKVLAIVDALLSYTERHFNRLDRLVQSSYVLDYTCAAMSAIGSVDAVGSSDTADMSLKPAPAEAFYESSDEDESE